jgi:hypothetical protein
VRPSTTTERSADAIPGATIFPVCGAFAVLLG